jgi:hypothetical protein
MKEDFFKNGRSGMPDRDEILEMYPAVRNPVPRELNWLMTDKVIRDFFWLHTEAPGRCPSSQYSPTAIDRLQPLSAKLQLPATTCNYRQLFGVNPGGCGAFMHHPCTQSCLRGGLDSPSCPIFIFFGLISLD